MTAKDIQTLSTAGKICRTGILAFVLFFSFFSVSSDLCEGSFITGTRYEAQIKASIVKYGDFHSDHLDFKRDQELELKWNLQNTEFPSLLQALVPEGVFPINHREEFSTHPYFVRLQEWGEAVVARAHYTYKGVHISTNVLFGVNSIRDRIRRWNKKWLVSSDAKAAVLYLHGGGTRTTSSVTFAPSLTHLEKYGIESVAIDLPMHAEGSRKIFGSIQDEVLSLGAFTRKYIPTNVPLFIYGHSFGAVFTDELMRMTGKYNGKTDFFHPSLKGVITASPPVLDPSPGKPLLEKIRNFIKSQNTARQMSEKLSDSGEGKVWTDVVGKISPLGEFFLGLIIAQMNQFVPKQQQKNLIHTLMMVGKHDPLVYLGMEDFFHKYFDSLPNVEVQYFDQRVDKMTNMLVEVKHLLNRYQYSKDVDSPLDIESIVRFIAEKLGTTPKDLLKKSKTGGHNDIKNDSLVFILQNYFNDLSARYWLKHFTGSRLMRDANHMENLANIRKSDYTSALKLYEQHLPENRLISLLKEIVLASSQREVSALQTALGNLRSHVSFSSVLSSVLKDLEKIKDKAEAKQLSKKILYRYFREPDKDSSSISNIVESIRNNKGLPKDFDVFPFDLEVPVPEYSIFTFPPTVRTHILDLLRRYNNENQPKWVNDKIVQDIRNILRIYDPQRILFRILDNFSVLSLKEFRKQYLPTLKSYSDQLSQFVQYEEMNKDLSALIKGKSISKIMKQALSIIKEHSVPPVTLDSYFIAKLKRQINHPDLPLEDAVSVLQWFQLPKDIQNQIIDMLKNAELRKDVYPAVRDLVIEHTPINLVDNIIQVLKKATTASSLLEFSKDFPNHPFFNQNERDQYFSGLENQQILKGILSDEISAEEIWSKRYYPLKKGPSYGRKSLMHQVFQGDGDIHQVLQDSFIPGNIREEIIGYYNNHMRIAYFIDGRHTPDLYHFSENLHNGKKLTEEQIKEYSRRIDEIRENVETVIELEQRMMGLFKEQRQLLKVLKGLKSIDHDIHLVRDVFKDAVENPPASMAQKYDEFHSKYYAPLEKTTYELTDLMYEAIFPLLEEQADLTFMEVQEKFHQIFLREDIQNLVQKREKLFNAWKQRHRELTEELIGILVEGEMGVNLQQSAINLYGHIPNFNFSIGEDTQYFILRAKSLRLAEVEAEILKIQKQIAVLSVEYDRLYPNSVLSVIQPIHPMEVLNFDSKNGPVSEYIEHNAQSFHNIWKVFKNLKASLPPELPGL